MNDQARVCSACLYRVEDLVERNDDAFELAEIEFQSQERARHSAGDGNLAVAQPGADGSIRRRIQSAGFRSNDHRAVAVAHARAAWEQRITIAQVSEGVDRDRGDMQFASQRPFL